MASKIVERLKEEQKKSAEDVNWLLSRNKNAANSALKFMRTSFAFKLGIAAFAVGLVYYAYTALSTLHFASIVYVFIGWLIVKKTDYSWSNWESYFALIFWLPAVVYSFVPDKYRLEKQ